MSGSQAYDKIKKKEKKKKDKPSFLYSRKAYVDEPRYYPTPRKLTRLHMLQFKPIPCKNKCVLNPVDNAIST